MSDFAICNRDRCYNEATHTTEDRMFAFCDDHRRPSTYMVSVASDATPYETIACCATIEIAVDAVRNFMLTERMTCHLYLQIEFVSQDGNREVIVTDLFLAGTDQD